MTYMATPQHKKLFPGGNEIHNFGNLFHGHHYYILSLSDSCPGVEKKISREICQIYNFYTKIISPWASSSWEKDVDVNVNVNDAYRQRTMADVIL